MMLKCILNKLNTEENAHNVLDYLLSEKSKETGAKVVAFMLRHGISNKVIKYLAIKLSINLFKAPTPQVVKVLLHKLVTLIYTPMGKRVISYYITQIVNAIKNSDGSLSDLLNHPFIKSFASNAFDEVVTNKVLRSLLRRVYV